MLHFTHRDNSRTLRLDIRALAVLLTHNCVQYMYYANSHPVDSARVLIVDNSLDGFARKPLKLFAKLASALIAGQCVENSSSRARSRFKARISDKEKLARVREQSKTSSSSRTAGFVPFWIIATESRANCTIRFLFTMTYEPIKRRESAIKREKRERSPILVSLS